MRLTNLDMDLLRTLTLAAELGGLGRAADRVGRSASAISLQMQKLEEQIGQPLFRKEGRGLSLTNSGDLLLAYAQRILALNDEAVAVTRQVDIEGVLRVGVPLDFTAKYLPQVLARFSSSNPHVHIELRADRSAELLQKFNQNMLDIVVILSTQDSHNASFSVELPAIWIGPKNFQMDPDKPLPLALLDPPCSFRQMATDALDQVRTPWRVAFTSPSLGGLWAANEAGLGITVRTKMGLPDNLQELQADRFHLPALANISVAVFNSGKSPRAEAASFLETILIETLQEVALNGSTPSKPSVSRHKEGAKTVLLRNASLETYGKRQHYHEQLHEKAS